MSAKSEVQYTLSSFRLGSPCSYAVDGEYIIGRLFGLIPVVRIHLGAVHYLRLASRSDASPLYMLFNYINFMPHMRSRCPVYVLQTRSHHRIFLKMESGTHFRLRQAIGKHNRKPMRMAA